MKTLDLNALYDYAERQGIHIDCYDLVKIESLSLTDEGECYIGINPFILKSHAEEKVKLAHEVGHCETVSFYDTNSPWYIRERCEARAEKWAIKKLIPKDELVEAHKNGICDVYELADYFSVTLDFMCAALKYYSNCY